MKWLRTRRLIDDQGNGSRSSGGESLAHVGCCAAGGRAASAGAPTSSFASQSSLLDDPCWRLAFPSHGILEQLVFSLQPVVVELRTWDRNAVVDKIGSSCALSVDISTRGYGWRQRTPRRRISNLRYRAGRSLADLIYSVSQSDRSAGFDPTSILSMFWCLHHRSP
jgi:hypothetical protein